MPLFVLGTLRTVRIALSNRIPKGIVQGLHDCGFPGAAFSN